MRAAEPPVRPLSASRGGVPDKSDPGRIRAALSAFQDIAAPGWNVKGANGPEPGRRRSKWLRPEQFPAGRW